MTPATSNAEVSRRLDDLVAEFREFRSELKQDYVLAKVAEAEKVATTIQLQGIEDELHLITKRLDTSEARALSLRRIFIGSALTMLGSLIVGLILLAVRAHG